MPLVEYVGNATPEDNTEVIDLHPGSKGEARSIRRGKRALLSATELRSLAANYQVAVVEDTGEEDPDAIPAEMPSGYDDAGYKEGEDPSNAVFGPESHPDDEFPSLITPEAQQEAQREQQASSSQTANVTAPASPSPSPPSPPGPSSAPSSATPASDQPSPSGQSPSESSTASPSTSG